MEYKSGSPTHLGLSSQAGNLTNGRLTPRLCWWLICGGGCWAEPTSCHAQWVIQLLQHIVFINPLITSVISCSNVLFVATSSMAPATVNPPIEYMNRPGSTDTGSWVVEGYLKKWKKWDLEKSLGKVETSWPVVKSWLPAGLVENVIHLNKFI